MFFNLSPLYCATVNGNLENVKLLLSKGADINSCSNLLHSPIDKAIQSRNLECLILLVNLKHKSGNSIITAIENYYFSAVPLLYEAGESLSYIDQNGNTPLSLACTFNKFDTIRFICEHLDSVDIEDSPNAKDYAVHWICKTRDPEVCRIVLRKGINVNRLDSKGFTGIHYAIDCATPEQLRDIIDQLINAGLCLDSSLLPPNERPKKTVLAELKSSIYKNRYSGLINWLISKGAK